MPKYTSLILIILATSLVLMPGVFAQDAKWPDHLSYQTNAENMVEIGDDVQPEVQIPLQLVIEPSKKEYLLGQKVEFELSLLNRGDATLRVKEINITTTYCMFNNQLWGTMESSGPNSVILAPGEAVRKKMRFAPSKSGNLDIFCSYGMAFKGIRPSAHVNVNIK